MKQLNIKFRVDVDTEKVRETIEDNLGVEILEIDELYESESTCFVKCVECNKEIKAEESIVFDTITEEIVMYVLKNCLRWKKQLTKIRWEMKNE